MIILLQKEATNDQINIPLLTLSFNTCMFWTFEHIHALISEMRTHSEIFSTTQPQMLLEYAISSDFFYFIIKIMIYRKSSETQFSVLSKKH